MTKISRIFIFVFLKKKLQLFRLQKLKTSFDCFFYNAPNKINVSNHKEVLNGDYDHVKITPIKYREKLGLASMILKQMIDEG